MKNKLIVFLIAAVALMVLPLIAQSAGNFWGSGYLPAAFQGTDFNIARPVRNLARPASSSPASDRATREFLTRLNQHHLQQFPGDSELAARISSYELAARMQSSIPDASNLDSEPDHIKALYGIDNPATQGFSRNCLMARRLLERGVRFVQVLNGGAFGSPRINWDGHEGIKENHDTQAATMDQPVAALLQDLKQRGMLEDTLFIWNTEFGRSPVTQGIGATGRITSAITVTGISCSRAGSAGAPR